MNTNQPRTERIDDLAFWVGLVWESVFIVAIGAVAYIGVLILLAVFA